MRFGGASSPPVPKTSSGARRAVAGTVEAAEARRAAHQEHRQLVVAAVVEIEGEVDAVRGEAADHGAEAVAVRHRRRAERGCDRDLDPDGAGLDLHAGAT